ncbi:MAG: bifunctional precorrin-2 dehydrogenase/sirohydrochlorin ferrochelatase [Acidobacteriota bacterium]|nr:bifunctional precorrin-2 dehydrogenase/sirohydrochlorin ferrochelatase [Acidobacteriota bacterium]
MALFPMFLKLEGRPALVVGAGCVGEAKIRSLLCAGAGVRVVAPVATARVRAWARAGRIVWAARPFAATDLRGVLLAVVATPSPDLNGRIAALARRRRILVNVVDEPERCDFYYPAIIRRGPLTIAISTEGHSPAFARRLRRHMERRIAPDLGRAVARLGNARRKLLSQSIEPGERKRLLIRLAGKIPLGGEHERQGVSGGCGPGRS